MVPPGLLPFLSLCLPLVTGGATPNERQAQLDAKGARAVSVFDELADALGVDLFGPAPQPWERFVPVYLPLSDPRRMLAAAADGAKRRRPGPTVVPVLLGEFHLKDDAYKFSSSSVLVRDRNATGGGDCTLIVDTGLALFKNTIVGGLSAHGLRPSSVHTVVVTHEGVDTMGNLNLFRDAQIISGRWRSRGDLFYDVPLAVLDDHVQGSSSDAPPLPPMRRLCADTVLYLTPGFGATDVSVVASNVTGFGTVAIVGNLILSERDEDVWPRFAADPLQKELWRNSRKAILCIADYIVPGHGQTFKVTRQMKRNSGCSTHS